MWVAFVGTRELNMHYVAVSTCLAEMIETDPIPHLYTLTSRALLKALDLKFFLPTQNPVRQLQL